MKTALQRMLRRAHVALSPAEPPKAVGIYFHALEKSDHAEFVRLVERLRDAGYRLTGSPLDLLAAGDRVSWLSFDDNYRSWYSSLDLFDRLDVKATFYVNTAPMRGDATEAETVDYYDRVAHRGERVALSPTELQEILAAGHVVGAHTHTHRNLAQLTTDEAVSDIANNLDLLQNHVGTPIEHFAFPFGLPRYFPANLIRPVRDLGIKTIAYATPGMQHARKTPFALHRTPWRFSRRSGDNWDELRVDGRLFVALTGRSPVG